MVMHVENENRLADAMGVAVNITHYCFHCDYLCKVDHNSLKVTKFKYNHWTSNCESNYMFITFLRTSALCNAIFAVDGIQNKILTYSTVVARCAVICWRCQVPSIAEFSTIAVFTLLFTVQTKAITVSTCWARTPIKTSTLGTVEPPWTDTVSNGFISCELQREAVEAIRTWVTAVSPWRVGECSCRTWLGCGTTNGAVEPNAAFKWVLSGWASWAKRAIFTRTRVARLSWCGTIKTCNNKIVVFVTQTCHLWFH